MTNSGFQLAWWIFLICGSAVICQDCPNEAISIKCDAQVGVSEIRETIWEVKGFKHRLAFCVRHQCDVTQKSRKPHGIQVLSIERGGTLTLKRTSWKSARHPVEFMCTVRAENSFSLLRSFITVDFSVECIWSHVGAVENVTNHLVDILPWELVRDVKLFDGLTENSIAGCNSHRGCYVTSENLKPRSALADRLQAKEGSILLSPIRRSDDGLKIHAEVHYIADLENSSAFPRRFTLKIRLKDGKGPKTTPLLPIFTQTEAKVLREVTKKRASKSAGISFNVTADKSFAKKEDGMDDKKRKTSTFYRTKQLVARIFTMTRELNQLVNDAGNLTNVVETDE
ncbi:uncharacterized protein [Montipora capricornis]|uniref:uncharacterized protein n=1 Tax=Montipora capricornis TaxID=246305 RepID=UPI0035F19D0F